MELDIIIPTYNAKKYLKRLLYSISIQKNIKNFHVYIINDNSDYNYSDEIIFFSKYIDIQEISLTTNVGPGLAREYGIKNSKSEYIIFIDSDDYLYSPNSLYYLYNTIISKDADLVISNFIYERDNEIKVMKKNNVWLHGKIFKRKFIIDNDIHFNNTRANEDNGFIRLCLFHHPKLEYLDEITYIYSENTNSITRNNNRAYKFTGLEWFAYNMQWAMDIACKKGLDQKQICLCSLGVLVAMYYYYLDLYEEYDVTKILVWSKKIKNIYDTYKNQYISENIIKYFLKEKEKEYLNINKIISLNEFLERINNVNDRYYNASI